MVIADIPGRGACTDAERRAALALAEEVPEAVVETHWVRPHWAPALAVASLLAVAGSLISIAVPLAGVILGAISALCLALEAAGRASPLRLRRRATQNVVSLPDPGDGVLLVIAAAYDAPRRGLVLNDRWRRFARGDARGWLAAGALVIAGASAARLLGVDDVWLGAIQLVPTVALIAALAAALDIALSEFSPAPASAAHVAIQAYDVLAGDPPETLVPGLLLHGAGTQGLRAQPLDHRRAVLLQIGPCTGGTPAWRTRHPQLEQAAAIAAEALGIEPGRRPHGARGAGRVPAIRIACLDERGLVPRAHQPDDTPENADPAAADAALDLALGIADALDAALTGSRAS